MALERRGNRHNCRITRDFLRKEFHIPCDGIVNLSRFSSVFAVEWQIQPLSQIRFPIAMRQQ